MEISPLKSASSLDAIPLDELSNNSRLSESEKVHEVSRQFEAVLLRQIISAARKSVLHSDNESKSSTSEIYQDMANNQLADSISQSGAFGLSRSLEVQLQRQTTGSHPAPAKP